MPTPRTTVRTTTAQSVKPVTAEAGWSHLMRALSRSAPRGLANVGAAGDHLSRLRRAR